MSDLDAINKKFQKEIVSGVSALVLLAVMAKSDEPMYGYQIAKLLTDNGNEMPIFKQGALYPVLRSLEKNEQLASQVEPSVSGPPRRYYTITELGRQSLGEWNNIWRQTQTFVENVLEGVEHDIQ